MKIVFSYHLFVYICNHRTLINVLNMNEEGKLNYKQQRAKIDANYSILVSFDISQNKEILLGDKKNTRMSILWQVLSYSKF